MAIPEIKICFMRLILVYNIYWLMYLARIFIDKKFNLVDMRFKLFQKPIWKSTLPRGSGMVLCFSKVHSDLPGCFHQFKTNLFAFLDGLGIIHTGFIVVADQY